MKIIEITRLLEKTMNSKMEQFVNLGQATKALAKKKKNPKQIVRLKIAMAQAVKELKPVEGMVLESNPKYTDLFAALTLFYDKYLLKSEETHYENIDKIIEEEYSQERTGK